MMPIKAKTSDHKTPLNNLVAFVSKKIGSLPKVSVSSNQASKDKATIGATKYNEIKHGVNRESRQLRGTTQLPSAPSPESFQLSEIVIPAFSQGFTVSAPSIVFSNIETRQQKYAKIEYSKNGHKLAILLAMDGGVSNNRRGFTASEVNTILENLHFIF